MGVESSVKCIKRKEKIRFSHNVTVLPLFPAVNTTTYKFQHVPVKHIVIGEALSVE